MALDATAAEATASAWLDSLTPALTAQQKADALPSLASLIGAIFDGIVAHAVVQPGTMVAGGDDVTGTGTVT